MERIEFKLDGASVIAPVRGCILLVRFRLAGRQELGSIFCDYGVLSGGSLHLFNCRTKTFLLDCQVPCDHALKVGATTLPGEQVGEWLSADPRRASVSNHLLDQVEAHPRLRGVVETLRQPVVMQRLRVEWLYELTVGRFENSVPYLHKEEELLKAWEQFCASLRDASVSPFEEANQEAQRFLASRGSSLSEPAQRLFRLSFLAACRKLFVFFSGAKETWAGSYTLESFKLSGSLADHVGQAVEAIGLRGNRISLRFGPGDHAYYLKPSLDQLNLYLEC